MPPQPDTIQFYKQEACLSTISDANPLLSVVGKCIVLDPNDYATRRPTQYAEADVYVCESIYDESKRMVQGPVQCGLKQYEHSRDVQKDEIYSFKNPVSLQKVWRVNKVMLFIVDIRKAATSCTIFSLRKPQLHPQ